ncbi:MAG: succinyl-diaminopimelate desuccinylase [Anaplasma sp.]
MPTSVDPISLSCRLMSFASITPDRSEALPFLARILSERGFKCDLLVFGSGDTAVTNLYARRGDTGPNLCFAGHTDVVPPGGIWRTDPFSPVVENGILYGRGAVDMKAAICAYIAAVSRTNTAQGRVSLLLTGNEEGAGCGHGTRSVLDWMESRHETIDYCVIGEPTSQAQFGDTIKVGRRGSANFQLLCYGTQGHVAYPEFAHNPIDRLLLTLRKIKEAQLGRGSAYFQPSHCEITSIDVGNVTKNIIPESAGAMFNIRFGDEYTAESLHKDIDAICASVAGRYTLSCEISGEAFVSPPDDRTEILRAAIKEVTGLEAKFGTGGGTSDARFIKDFCPVVEFGLLCRTAHGVDECTPIDDVLQLTKIYEKFIEGFFAR